MHKRPFHRAVIAELRHSATLARADRSAVKAPKKSRRSVFLSVRVIASSAPYKSAFSAVPICVRERCPMSKENTTDVAVLQEKVREIILEELELEPAELTATGHFVDDYDADSLSLITIVARIEKELGVAVPQDEMENMPNLDGVFEVIARYAVE